MRSFQASCGRGTSRREQQLTGPEMKVRARGKYKGPSKRAKHLALRAVFGPL